MGVSLIINTINRGKNNFHEILKKQKYQLIGQNAAVKKCRWLHKSLTEDKVCYKEKFYGIRSHRCIQMTPTLICNLKCKFCWRVHPDDISLKDQLTSLNLNGELIVRESIKAQKKMLSGYKSQVISGRINEKKFNESLHPLHAAISLDGEPTLYYDIDRLIEAYSKEGLTTFLVSNGTRSDVLKNLRNEPTQLYISLYAPDRDTFNNICSPYSKTQWTNIIQTLEMLSTFKCPTVVRLTLVKDVNMNKIEKYCQLIKKSSPTYIEAKAYMYVGFSRQRLLFHNMPTYKEISNFSKELAQEISYRDIDGCAESRVRLLSKLDKPIKIC